MVRLLLAALVLIAAVVVAYYIWHSQHTSKTSINLPGNHDITIQHSNP